MIKALQEKSGKDLLPFALFHAKQKKNTEVDTLH